MKRLSAILGALLVTAAFPAAAPLPAANTFDVTADTIEGCSCPLFCSCYFGPSANEHMCQMNNVYKFRKGSHYGDVDLTNQMFWVSGDLGGEWHHKPGPGMPMAWAVMTFDKTSTPQQRKAIEKIFAGVFNVKWKSYKTREDSITWHDDAKTAHATMASGTGEITLDKTSTNRPDKSGPVVIKNLQYWFSNSNEGFALAYATHRFNGDTKFSHTKRNGFTIAWTAKGNIS